MNKASQLAGHHTGKTLMADLKQNRGKMRGEISLSRYVILYVTT